MAVQNLMPLVLSLVLIAIFIGVGYTILGNFQANLIAQNQTAAAQQVGKVSDTLGTLVNWIPTIVIILVAALIIGVVLSAFGRRRM